MSAYICDRHHFVYLVGAAMARRFNPHGGGGLSWFHGDRRHAVTAGDFERAAEVANLLLCENMRSVSHRYPGESSATLPGPNGGVSLILARDFPLSVPFEPVQVLKAIHCLEYQSCEHDEWKDSEAFAFLQALVGVVCRTLPGYDAAEWGAPEVRSSVSNQTK